MIKIEEILKRHEPPEVPAQEPPKQFEKTFIDLEEREHQSTGHLWIYFPMLDNLLIFKMNLVYAYNFVASIVRHGFHIFFS